MKNLLSIDRVITRRSKSSTDYPVIAVLDIVKLHDKIPSETNVVFSSFKSFRKAQ